MSDDEIAEMRVELEDLRAFKRVVMQNFQSLQNGFVEYSTAGNLHRQPTSFKVKPGCFCRNCGPTNKSHGDNASGECSEPTSTSQP